MDSDDKSQATSDVATVSQLKGKVAVITGGGRGIGRALALGLSLAGAEVAICARTESELAETAQEILGKTGSQPLHQVADVASVEDAAKLTEAVAKRWGRIDVLVNNAATIGPVGPIAAVSVKDWTAALQTNVGSVVNMTRAVLPLMHDGGSVINLSGGGVGGNSQQERVSAYVASKGALAVLTEVMAQELSPRGIRVNAVAPGATATSFRQPILDAGRDLAGEKSYEEALHQSDAPSFLDKFIKLVVWLSSEESKWLTGRLLSARWDDAEQLENNREQIERSALYKLRRIDGQLFRAAD